MNVHLVIAGIIANDANCDHDLGPDFCLPPNEFIHDSCDEECVRIGYMSGGCVDKDLHVPFVAIQNDCVCKTC